ncbi:MULTISPECIES: hypothetical protein [Sphingobacterium]|uniref:hypothetical protein n=1 Tax=Sphingobacterium TaxID=28453 RepID=UPI0013DB3299|nr:MULTISPECIES: hypothetical protein [unclassified Sphingobacterium]
MPYLRLKVQRGFAKWKSDDQRKSSKSNFCVGAGDRVAMHSLQGKMKAMHGVYVAVK